MAHVMTVQLKTLTPLWTGGVDQKPDRLHETGLIGSMRSWYEALVRGLGGYACDPTDEADKCREYDPTNGPKSICAACYLFGTTGWARLFRLSLVASSVSGQPLHFYTSLPMNKGWLRRIFPMDGTTVPFGKLQLKITGRGADDAFAFGQLAWTLLFLAQHGGLGARLQHGFGQVTLETDLRDVGSQSGNTLGNRLGEFLHNNVHKDWPSCAAFFSRKYHIPNNDSILKAIAHPSRRVGQPPGAGAVPYVPCAFDLRYKGEIQGKVLGFRQWLGTRGWSMDDIKELMGETQAQRDEERSASRLNIGMPWSDGARGRGVKVFGFAPHRIGVTRVVNEIDAYMHDLFKCNPDQDGY